MELFIVTSLNHFEQYEDDWSRILEDKQNTNPFIEFAWVYEWWKHFGDQWNVEIMVVKLDNNCVGFFPFIHHRKGFVGNYSFIALGEANYMDFIIVDELLDDVIAFVLDEIFRTQKNVVFSLHGLLESSHTTRSLENYLQNRTYSFSVHRVVTPYIDLKKIKLPEYMNKRQKLHRLSRREKRLRDNGIIEVLQSHPEEMETIFTIHRKQWKKKKDTSGFTNEKKKEFFRALAFNNEGPCKTEIDSLYLNGTMIAFDYGFKCRGRYVTYVLGYDTNFEIFSPGRILEKETILLCKKENEEIFDLSIGYESYKFDWNTNVDYTRKMIFSSAGVSAKMLRHFYSLKEKMIERIKKNYRIVLLKRNTLGKLSYVMRNVFHKTEYKEARTDLKSFIIRLRNRLYERHHYFIYQQKREELEDPPNEMNFHELTLSEAINKHQMTDHQLNEICRKIYGGYRGYYPNNNNSFEEIIWLNEKVLRIDSIPYFENFRKRSLFIEQWKEWNLHEICGFIKKNSNAGIIFATVKDGSTAEIAKLESLGFSIYKSVYKRTYFGFTKMRITDLESSR